MSRNTSHLPPRYFNLEYLQKRTKMDFSRPKDIQPRKTSSFHQPSSDYDKSCHNRSFERSFHEHDVSTQKVQNECLQLKQLLLKRTSELEREANQICRDVKVIEKLPTPIKLPVNQVLVAPTPAPPVDLNYYQTFKPIFEKLNNLVEQSNVQNEKQIKTKLCSIFDSIEMDSQRGERTERTEQLVGLVESLIQEFVLPQQQKKQKEFVKLTIHLQSLDQTLAQIQKRLDCTEDCGYMKYEVLQDSVIYNEQITQFNVSRNQSCKLIDLQFLQEKSVEIPLKYFKQAIQSQKCQQYSQIILIPIAWSKFRILFIIKSNELSECMQMQQLMQQQIELKQLKQRNSIDNLSALLQHSIHTLKRQTLRRIRLFNQQIKKIRRVYLKRAFRKLKAVKAAESQTLNNQLSKLLLLSARQVVKNQQHAARTLSKVVASYESKLVASGFRALMQSDDFVIMLQSLQNEPGLDNFLYQVQYLLGEKLVICILNTELQSLTSYLPNYGVIQEFYESIDDLAQFETLYYLTENIHNELLQLHVNLEYRHIWQVQSDLFLITLSNMKTHFLSKVALILTNAIQTQRARYLQFFRFIRERQEKFLLKKKAWVFCKWRRSQDDLLSQYKSQINQLQQENEITSRSTCQMQIDLQNLMIQNELKQKCLASALLENLLVRRDLEQKFKLNAFRIWRLGTQQVRHTAQRIQTGFFLTEIYLTKVYKCLLDQAFREIAMASYGQTIVSPNKQTKRSYFTREPTRRSQDDLEQSVLWDVHQMKVCTPNHNMSIVTYGDQSFSPNQTINNSLSMQEDPIYKFHSQRASKPSKHQKQKSSNLDQENQQNQNKIYSQRTKEFVRKLSQSKSSHQRFNSTQQAANSQFSFYDKSELLN